MRRLMLVALLLWGMPRHLAWAGDGIELQLESIRTLPLYDAKSGKPDGFYLQAEVRVEISQASFQMLMLDRNMGQPRLARVWLQSNAPHSPRWFFDPLLPHGDPLRWTGQVTTSVALEVRGAGFEQRGIVERGIVEEGWVLASTRVPKTSLERRLEGRVTVDRDHGLISLPPFCAAWLQEPQNRLTIDQQPVARLLAVDAVRGVVQITPRADLAAHRLGVLFGKTNQYVRLADLAPQRRRAPKELKPDEDQPAKGLQRWWGPAREPLATITRERCQR